MRGYRRNAMRVRYLSAEALSQDTQGVPSPPSMTPVVSAKVKGLLDDLVSLNMLEVKELTDALKDRLGIDDSASMPMAINPAMFAGMGAAPAPAAEEKVEEKTAFDLKLNKFDAAKKIAVIKEVRALTGLGLKEAKALVEDAPKVFKTEVPKDEAEQIRDKLKEIGGEVLLE
ncbi:50S ribosomal protein L12, chloroplastic [Gracilariopsis chorda]|uniref:50S ribosomal protein L12, chloroplastic n=1 Tax=Gracilariopsis chorda TaxID=448386 RepID=A0A2V3IRG8_9FLOR|nr:50S ribosomal protein L12, chloroplastic [Gracilariopsis chorda]|eukprot:PXF44716.1 50S ribosomal protein L12, chloroplastic [Gracilariopsis chorda]